MVWANRVIWDCKESHPHTTQKCVHYDTMSLLLSIVNNAVFDVFIRFHIFLLYSFIGAGGLCHLFGGKAFFLIGVKNIQSPPAL